MFDTTALLVLVVICPSMVVSEAVTNIPLIQWLDGECSLYSVRHGGYPQVGLTHSQPDTGISLCRELCTRSTDCGSFTITTDDLCQLYNIDDAILTQNLVDNWHHSTSYDWYSKICSYDIGASDESCSDFSNKYKDMDIAWSWRLTNTYWYGAGLVSPEMCHKWCVMYTGCTSAGYYSSSQGADGYGYCNLYTTTISDLEAAGLHEDIIHYTDPLDSYTVYDRWCGDLGPYQPTELGPVTPTPTPAPECEDTVAEVKLTLPFTLEAAGKYDVLLSLVVCKRQ